MYISTRVPLNRSPSFLPEILDEAQPHNDGSKCSTFHQYGHSIPYKINNHDLSRSCNTVLHTTLLLTQSYRLQNLWADMWNRTGWCEPGWRNLSGSTHTGQWLNQYVKAPTVIFTNEYAWLHFCNFPNESSSVWVVG